MKNINPFEPSEIYVEITVEKKQYVFNAKLAICDLKKIKHQFIDKRAKAYRPCVDSPLYDVRTLGDMRQYIETHGSSTAKKHLLDLYGIGQYTANAILYFASASKMISKTKK